MNNTILNVGVSEGVNEGVKLPKKAKRHTKSCRVLFNYINANTNSPIFWGSF
jgi:hypothetical protein